MFRQRQLQRSLLLHNRAFLSFGTCLVLYGCSQLLDAALEHTTLRPAHLIPTPDSCMPPPPLSLHFLTRDNFTHALLIHSYHFLCVPTLRFALELIRASRAATATGAASPPSSSSIPSVSLHRQLLGGGRRGLMLPVAGNARTKVARMQGG